MEHVPRQQYTKEFREQAVRLILAQQVPIAEGWLYFSGIKDVFTCEVVGHAMGARMTMAVGAKRPRPGLIHHSDRGPQHCAQDYQAQLR